MFRNTSHDKVTQIIIDSLTFMMYVYQIKTKLYPNKLILESANIEAKRFPRLFIKSCKQRMTPTVPICNVYHFDMG